MKNIQKDRKGIILAGGTGSRLFPITTTVSKQLLPVYDKPMIFYGLSTLILSGIKDILIIGTKNYINNYISHFKNGQNLGIRISYATQDSPNGIPEAFIIGRDFIGSSPVALMLGDNIIHGNDLSRILQEANQSSKATVFGVKVNNPQSFGIAQLDIYGALSKVIEKPKEDIGNLAIIGLYFFPNKIINYALKLIKSDRGELEITEIINLLLLNDLSSVKLQKLGRGFSWFDAGTPKSLLDASTYISVIQERQNILIGSPEEATVIMGNFPKNLMSKYCNDILSVPYFEKVAHALEDLNDYD